MFQMLVAMTVATAVVTSSPDAADTAMQQEWRSDYGQALEATRTNERPLLVVIDRQDDEKLSESALADSAETLAKYNLCRVDASTPYGKEVASSFKAAEFPFLAIIDKSGSVILRKEAGDAGIAQWKNAVEENQLGLRQAPVAHTVAYRGETSTPAVSATPATETVIEGFSTGMPVSSPAVASPGYCPACQRAAMGLQ